MTNRGHTSPIWPVVRVWGSTSGRWPTIGWSTNWARSKSADSIQSHQCPKIGHNSARRARRAATEPCSRHSQLDSHRKSSVPGRSGELRGPLEAPDPDVASSPANMLQLDASILANVQYYLKSSEVQNSYETSLTALYLASKLGTVIAQDNGQDLNENQP